MYSRNEFLVTVAVFLCKQKAQDSLSYDYFGTCKHVYRDPKFQHQSIQNGAKKFLHSCKVIYLALF